MHDTKAAPRGAAFFFSPCGALHATRPLPDAHCVRGRQVSCAGDTSVDVLQNESDAERLDQASRGLGRAFAEAMAEYGADIACVGRDMAKLAETIKIIGKYKNRAIAIKADVTKEVEVKYMVDETVRQFGKIDILFIPVGGNYTIDAEQAWRVIHSLKPKIAIPMHYRIEGLSIPIAGIDPFLEKNTF
jgi:hypothetical protein